jgi:hypothetical protein
MLLIIGYMGREKYNTSLELTSIPRPSRLSDRDRRSEASKPQVNIHC